MKEININNEVYVKKSDLELKDSEIKIVVLQRGWVYVGYFEREGSDCTITKAKNIRKWGTKKGLGELVNGKLDNTELDESGTVRFDYLTVVCTLDCEVTAWEKEL